MSITRGFYLTKEEALEHLTVLSEVLNIVELYGFLHDTTEEKKYTEKRLTSLQALRNKLINVYNNRS
jgi:hypothetical protein